MQRKYKTTTMVLSAEKRPYFTRSRVDSNDLANFRTKRRDAFLKLPSKTSLHTRFWWQKTNSSFSYGEFWKSHFHQPKLFLQTGMSFCNFKCGFQRLSLFFFSNIFTVFIEKRSICKAINLPRFENDKKITLKFFEKKKSIHMLIEVHSNYIL